MSDIYEYGRGSIWVGHASLVIESDDDRYNGILPPEKARKLALEILSKWPAPAEPPKPKGLDP